MNQGAITIVVLGGVFALLFARRLLRGGRMSPEVVRAKLAAGAVVLDVRRDDEFRAGAYPGALHIPLHELPARMGEIPRGKPVVVYCGMGGRAESAAGLLRGSGFADVLNAGGLRDMPR